jgi:hypothetical protein
MMSAERTPACSSTLPASRRPSRTASSRPSATAPRCPWSTAPRKPTRIQDRAHLLRAGAQEPARRQCQPGRQVLHLLRQALAHRHRHRAGQGAGVVRRQADDLNKSHRRRSRNRPRAPAHRLRRPRQRLHHAVPGQPDRQVERGSRHQVPQAGDKTAKYVVDRLDVHYQPGHISARMGETKEADGKFLPWVASSPRTASCPSARCTRERAADRHQRRQDGSCWPTTRCVPRAARLHHLQARSDQDPPGVHIDDFPLAVKDPRTPACSATARRSPSS